MSSASALPVLDNWWRDSSRDFVFGPFNGMAAFPFVVFMFHITWMTFGLALGTAVVLSVIERFYGVTLEVALLWLRALVAGRRVRRVPSLGRYCLMK